MARQPVLEATRATLVTERSRVGDELARTLHMASILRDDPLGIEDDFDDLLDQPDDEEDPNRMDNEFLSEDPDDDEDDEDDDTVSESSYDKQDNAPWAQVPTRVARKFIKQHPDAVIDIVFPTVYEEDRTAKIKDLGTAQALGSITHQRMSEQMAKEFGFEQYDYSEEQQQISHEMKTLPPKELGVADTIAQGVLGLGKFGPGGDVASGGASNFGGGGIGAPAAALAADANKPVLRRADVSGTGKASFRKAQRNPVG